MNPKEAELPISEVEGVIYVVKKGDQYLIAKRIKESSNFHNQFLFPGGLVEETDLNWEEAVKREVGEERGARVTCSKLVSTVTYPHPNGSIIKQHIFLIEEDGYEGEMGNLEPDKEELYWMSLDELSQVCTTPPAQAVLGALETNGVFNEARKED